MQTWTKTPKFSIPWNPVWNPRSNRKFPRIPIESKGKHPGNLAQIPKNDALFERRYIFQTIIFAIFVEFPDCCCLFSCINCITPTKQTRGLAYHKPTMWCLNHIEAEVLQFQSKEEHHPWANIAVQGCHVFIHGQWSFSPPKKSTFLCSDWLIHLY